MTVGKKTFRSIKFDKPDGSSEGSQQVIKLYEGGAAGYVSGFVRRVSGNGEGYIEVYGSFKAEPTDNDLFDLDGYWWDDNLNQFMWWQENEFPYFVIKDYPDDSNPYTVEVYLTGF